MWFKSNFWKLCAMIAVIVFAYGIYLDAQVKSRFSGNKWVVPAQLYARPLQLTVGEDLRVEEVTQELELLGYRKVKKIQQSGEYKLNGTDIQIFRREFAFAEGYEQAAQYRLSLRHGKLINLREEETGTFIETLRLEPMMVTRIVTQSREDRMLISLDDVPTELIETLLHTEDRGFYQHLGVSPVGIARALIANIKAGRTVQGGSTLTQQLAKNLFLTRERSLWRKVNEALMSVIMEIRYSKEEILETYLNEVFLGQKGNLAIHGFGLASYYYFNRPINELNLTEIATLVGMIKGPSYYNPFRFPERSMQRRDLVLRTLMDANFITAAEYRESVEKPIGVVNKGLLSQHKYPAFMDVVNRELRRVLPSPELRDSGIKIFSTLDPHIQRAAEEAVSAQLPKLAQERKIPDLNTALISSNYKTGEIRALVGGKDFSYRGFNRVLDANRPIGSLIKPAVYLTALEDSQHYNLMSPIDDKPIKLRSSQGKFWQPQNVDKKFRGKVNLVTALTQSLNVPTVNLGMELGLDSVINTINRLGVEKEVPAYPSITLGAVNLSPRTVNQMFQTIANVGIQQELHAITAISSHEDRLIWYRQADPIIVVDKKAAYLTNYALHKVTKEGTGKRLLRHFPNVNLAGKTGTTDDYRDSWFTGMDSKLVTTIWIGTDDNQRTGLTGATGALSLYTQLQKIVKPRSFVMPMPDGIGIAHFDAQNAVRLQAGCPGTVSVPADLTMLPSATDCAGKKVAKKEKGFWERLFGG